MDRIIFYGMLTALVTLVAICVMSYKGTDVDKQIRALEDYQKLISIKIIQLNDRVRLLEKKGRVWE